MPKIRSCMDEIKEYVPGKEIEEIAMKYGLVPGDILKLGSNENQLGPSPRAVEAIKQHAGEVNIYPSSEAIELRHAIAEYVGSYPENIAIGNGSDGVLNTITRMFLEPRVETIISIPTFSYYEIVTKICDATPVFIQRTEEYEDDLDGILEKITDKTRAVFLCSPNNPSGNTTSREAVTEIAELTDALVIVDEAYAEFAGSSLVDLVEEYDNVIITRTFSKAFGLGGLRLGYGVMPEWIAKEYMKAREPFPVNRIAQIAGIAALQDREFLGMSIGNAKAGRGYLSNNIPFKVYPSEANFIMIDVSPYTATEVCERLLQMGIIIRDCTPMRGAGENLIRITVGTQEQNARVVKAFQVFAEES